jgi:hypothetical protein
MKNDPNPNPYSVPADTTVAGETTAALPDKASGRFGVILLAVAWAYWAWLLSDLWRKPVGDLVALLVFASVTFTAGVCGHLLYRYVLRWRGTVLFSLLLGPLPVLGLLGLLFGSARGMFEILTLPIEFVVRPNWTHRVTFSLPVFFSIVVLSIAHPLKPCLTNAIITAIGISLWYGLAILIGASAG